MRDWKAFREKVQSEGGECRRCGLIGADAAHIIPRSRVPGPEAMDPLNCIPLCRPCHTAFDHGRLDVLGLLTVDEQLFAVGLVGLGEAYRRLTRAGVAEQADAPRSKRGEPMVRGGSIPSAGTKGGSVREDKASEMAYREALERIASREYRGSSYSCQVVACEALRGHWPLHEAKGET